MTPLGRPPTAAGDGRDGRGRASSTLAERRISRVSTRHDSGPGAAGRRLNRGSPHVAQRDSRVAAGESVRATNSEWTTMKTSSDAIRREICNVRRKAHVRPCSLIYRTEPKTKRYGKELETKGFAQKIWSAYYQWRQLGLT